MNATHPLSVKIIKNYCYCYQKKKSVIKGKEKKRGRERGERKEKGVKENGKEGEKKKP